MTSKTAQYTIEFKESYWAIAFQAMASPCEILVRCNDKSEAEHLASLALSETRRIEHTYSRYRDDNIVCRINHSDGNPVTVNNELARLLDYADQCYRLSDGLFDITSGILRKAWKFDGSSVTPDKALIESLRERVGWDKVSWDGHNLRLQPGQEIDLGGLGKEYAVDRVAEMLFQTYGVSLMVNFGGDIRAIAAENQRAPWIVGIENPRLQNDAVGQIELINGGIATSGDLHRFCYIDGVRMGHILNPRTGWPVADAPRSVTVLADSSVEAGFLATLTMLQGANAELFLKEQQISGHCIR
jgi:thiamine biosynthesis lipoprotein